MTHVDPKVVKWVLQNLPLDDGLFLTGGQSVTFWAEHYSTAPELEQYGPLTTKDIDFFGRHEAALKLADALGGKVRAPISGGNETFVEAIVDVPLHDGTTLSIDFINYVLGTNRREIEERRLDLVVSIVKDDGSSGQLIVPITHPLHVLQSKVTNLVKLGRGDQTGRTIAQRQAKASSIVLREYLDEVLSQGARDEAQGAMKRLHHWLRTDEVGRSAHHHLDLDPLQTLKGHLDDERLDPRWRKHNLQAWINDIAAAREATKKAANCRTANKSRAAEDESIA